LRHFGEAWYKGCWVNGSPVTHGCVLHYQNIVPIRRRGWEERGEELSKWDWHYWTFFWQLEAFRLGLFNKLRFTLRSWRWLRLILELRGLPCFGWEWRIIYEALINIIFNKYYTNSFCHFIPF
jgi:hypothetical protein